jgi:hypothetical protein
MKSIVYPAVFIGALFATSATIAAPVTLYNQNFENPTGYVNQGGDVSLTSVNSHYGNQPAGFQFGQTNTVETLNVSGSQRGAGSAAFGTGWSDPSGQGGNFALGMLSDFQNDYLGLSFNIGSYAFFNVYVDISSIDLSTFSGPFIPAGGLTPVFRFSLFDNPAGTAGVGSGTALSFFDLTGTASAHDVFDWTSGAFGLSTLGNTNGNVTLRIDLLLGEYAALDNLRLEASETPPVTPVPLPAGLPLLLGGLAAFGLVRRSARKDS